MNMNSSVLGVLAFVLYCIAVFNLEITVAAVTKGTPSKQIKAVCPALRFRGVGLCAEFCSLDSECPDGQKCCSNGCGHQCTVPHTVKPGRCHAHPMTTSMCAEFCEHDGQCPGEEKCCRTRCGHACSAPC